ncbi:gliding motility-associated protein GldE [Flavobacterium sp. xlx-214]|uniref:gliding motility-associated protein GldE n=1 Tax=unclassified Flavobacterium TaxID=196869 RepID=UPI0013D52B5A|nr:MULTISPECIES: gliding motility-associated protein GldE [unclassified Flavobacterium]MBA5793887.1 gliding motility-associated protein GldE [Flavobacterium sp. xlx-221]QMI84812.1 gliding motility-associated protein GldE [Flavobacterium sp. xlx-214]
MEPESAIPPLLFITLISASLLISLFFVALFAATEVAYFSTSKNRYEQLVELFPKKALLYQKLLEKPIKLQATINLSNTAFKVLFLWSLFVLYTHFFIITFWGIAITVILGSFALAFFGEIYPRMYSSRQLNKVVVQSINTIAFFTALLSPITWIFRKLNRYLNGKIDKKDDSFSMEQLSQALEMTDYNPSNEDEQRILEGIASFGSTDVSQVMTPRIDIFALSDDELFHEIIPQVIEKGYSRIPVYKDSIDHIVGILYIKDLIPFLDKKVFQWTTLLREPYFIPEGQKLDDLLTDFQSNKNHLAVVVDEFGETVGIITLEDILEEIVGEIADELDEDDPLYQKLNANVFIFDGKISILDFCRMLDIDEEPFEETRKDAESLGGFLLEQVEDFPKIDDIITFENYVFKIVNINKRRLEKIKVTINENT